MLGFHVPWISGEPRRADRELEDVRWFTRAEIAEIMAPPSFAIAARLLDGWLQR
jgi:NADH pyrophosphatase NudC (nudix superfamily)